MKQCVLIPLMALTAKNFVVVMENVIVGYVIAILAMV